MKRLLWHHPTKIKYMVDTGITLLKISLVLLAIVSFMASMEMEMEINSENLWYSRNEAIFRTINQGDG